MVSGMIWIQAIAFGLINAMHSFQEVHLLRSHWLGAEAGHPRGQDGFRQPRHHGQGVGPRHRPPGIHSDIFADIFPHIFSLCINQSSNSCFVSSTGSPSALFSIIHKFTSLHKSRSARSPWTAPWCRWFSPTPASSSTATRRAKWTSSTSRPRCVPDLCPQSSSAWTSTGIKIWGISWRAWV